MCEPVCGGQIREPASLPAQATDRLTACFNVLTLGRFGREKRERESERERARARERERERERERNILTPQTCADTLGSYATTTATTVKRGPLSEREGRDREIKEERET